MIRTLVAMLLILAPLTSAQLIPQNSALDAELLYYEPVPAHPGERITAYIVIENDGGSPSSPGTLEIIDSQTIQVANENEQEKRYPGIPSQESFLAKVQLQVSPHASEGEHTIRVRIKPDQAASSTERDLTFTIQGRPSVLAISEAHMEPSGVEPGEPFTLALTVTNMGETLIRNLVAKLNLDDLSVSPTSGSNAKTIQSVRPGESADITYSLTSFADAQAGSYKVPITLDYEDERGENKSQEEVIGITLSTQPDLLIYFDSVALTSDKLEGEVVVRVVNRGLSEIKLLSLEIIENENVQVTSESSILYVGNIDEDDYESATLTIDVAEEATEVPVRITYRDALNEFHTEERTLTLRVQPATENGNALLWTVVIIIAIAAGVWYWRRKRK